MRTKTLAALVLGCAVLCTAPAAEARNSLGPHAGVGRGPDDFMLGAQAEFGPALGSAWFAPGLDMAFSDGANVAMINGDLRWYLLPLPDTGIRFYGQAGPTFVLSPDDAVGLTLGLGADIPMRNARRYHFDVRFGFGDVPDLRIALGVLFRI